MLRVLIVLVAAFTLSFSTGFADTALSDSASGRDPGERLIDQWFTTGDLPLDDFDGDLTYMLSPEKVKGLPITLETFLGGYQSVRRSFEHGEDEPPGGYSRYILSFTTQTFDLYLHLTESLKIDSIYLKFPMSPAADQTSRYIIPPPGWTKFTIPPMMKKVGVTELFFSPEYGHTAFNQNLNVIAVGSDAKSLKSALDTVQKRFLTKPKNLTSEAKRCGRFQAIEVSGALANPFGQKTKFRELTILANLKLYSVTYTRLATQSDAPEAVAALESLCDNPIFGGIGFLLR